MDAPLDKLGLKGMRLKFGGTLQRTRVDDPISGEVRNWSDFFPDWRWNVDFRHDVGKFSYGFTVEDRDRFTFFRTDEYDINFNGGPSAPPSSNIVPAMARPSRWISTMRSTHRAIATASCFARTEPFLPRSSTSSASGPPPQLRPDPEADLRRRGNGSGVAPAG